VTRPPLSKELSAEVMFASDRTCCVCRAEKTRVQIHHIDEDPTNNAFDNLAVVCLNCHSDAHTDGAFVRNLTPELIQLYNTSWRGIAKLRLTGTQPETGQREFASEVFLEASLDCHSWKVWYMSLYRSDFPGAETGSFRDVWDAMIHLWQHEYNENLWKHFLPLFTEGVEDVQLRFDRLIQLFPDVLPYEFRSQLLRAHRELNTIRHSYLWVPDTLRRHADKADPNLVFNSRFSRMIELLRDVAREADRRRKLIIADAG
jgi:hypothetical protein